jgi:hypothetical protein
MSLALSGPLQAAFKSAPGRFVVSPSVTDLCKLLGILSFAAFMQLEIFRIKIPKNERRR